MPKGKYIRKKAKYQYKNLICQGCHGEFDSKKRNKKQRYCSKKCSAKYVINKGRFGNRPAWNKGLKKSGMSGKSFTEETRRKMAISQMGERGNNWKGGISTKNEIDRKGIRFKIWREKVFKRDNWVCQDCGIKAKKGKRVILHPHHLKGFSMFKKLRYAVNNGITLCRECHKKRHKLPKKA